MPLYSLSLLLKMDLFPLKSKRRMFSSYQILSVFPSCHFSMDSTAFAVCILNVCFLFFLCKTDILGKLRNRLAGFTFFNSIPLEFWVHLSCV